ncbi:hypothetical protein O7606_27200 [Micromonospora sp. WMMD882]|uniref:hypothetical protein n=1 Tax=Micromonospora sp. WMMD882 TaxID=3015151 RepID=UPI00248B0B8B|nr:hypothetical protein [Micromonospora sp. WMMD882]WBB79770.1 hypothetical protein O7606_27200 [Micromonospora sp. WMMD882]
MARAETKQRAATVRTRRTSRGAPNRSGPAVTLLAVSALAAAWAGAMLTGVGQTAYGYLFFFTEFYAGVVTLVALSLTVMLGLLATDRLVLLIPHRVLMQSAHRATGIIGVSGLVLHVLTKIATGRAAATDAILPFLGGRGLHVGLGTVAALLMASVLWTGLVRARFAGVGPKWLWRSLHATAYLSWPFALLHGLNAGRAPATWVTLSYLACVLLVLVALVVRLSVNLGRRRRERAQSAALDRALARRATDRAAARGVRARLTRRRDAGTESAPARGRTVRRAASWAEPPEPAQERTGWPTRRSGRGAERFAVPVVPPPGTVSDATTTTTARRRRRAGTEPGVDLTTPTPVEAGASAGRRRRPAADAGPEPVARGRRRAEPARSRRAASAGDRYPAAEDLSGRAGTRYAPTGDRYLPDEERYLPEEDRYLSDEERSTPVSPGWADEPVSTPVTATSGAGWQGWRSEPEEPWDSPRRWADSGDRRTLGVAGAATTGRAGRHSADDDAPEPVTEYWRPPSRYVPDESPLPPDDTPTLVDLAARRARRAAGESRSARRRRATADAVDGAYWAGLRGEAK